MLRNKKVDVQAKQFSKVLQAKPKNLQGVFTGFGFAQMAHAPFRPPRPMHKKIVSLRSTIFYKLRYYYNKKVRKMQIYRFFTPFPLFLK